MASIVNKNSITATLPLVINTSKDKKLTKASRTSSSLVCIYIYIFFYTLLEIL